MGGKHKQNPLRCLAYKHYNIKKAKVKIQILLNLHADLLISVGFANRFYKICMFYTTEIVKSAKFKNFLFFFTKKKSFAKISSR